MKTTLGYRIKLLRKEFNLSQIEFAKIIGVNNSTLSQYENNINTPNDEMKIKIANYFDVSLDYLVGRSDIRSDLSVNSAFSINVEELEEEDIEYVKGLVERLKNKHSK